MPNRYDDQSVELYSVSSNRRGSRVPHRRKRKKAVTRIVINTVASVVLVLSILMLAATAFLGSRPLQLQYEEPSDQFEELVLSEHSNVSYVLVVGLDESESLTDIMMVACIDHEQSTMNILQIPRDSFVGTDVPSGKLNAVYNNNREGESKINALRRRLSSNLGIPIDHYVIFTLPAFRNIVDAVGGVTINIIQKNGLYIEDHTTNPKTHMTIGPGEVTLNGVMAEGFMRKRYGDASGRYEEGYGNGDMSRVQQQRIFYAAVAKKMKEMSLTQMLSVASSCYDQIQTSMSISECLAYAKEIQAINLEDMIIETTPGASCWYNGLSYFSIRRSEYVELFNKYFNPYGMPLSEEDCNIPDLIEYTGQNYVGNVMTEGGSFSNIIDNNDGVDEPDTQTAE